MTTIISEILATVSSAMEKNTNNYAAVSDAVSACSAKLWSMVQNKSMMPAEYDSLMAPVYEKAMAIYRAGLADEGFARQIFRVDLERAIEREDYGSNWNDVLEQMGDISRSVKEDFLAEFDMDEDEFDNNKILKGALSMALFDVQLRLLNKVA